MAAPTVTSKLGLLVDPDGESVIDSQGTNWNKVDTASGVQTVDAGGTAPLPYENAPVAERLKGISYKLTSNGAGGWNKKYVTYPYVYCAFTPNMSVGSSGSTTTWGWNTYDLNNSVNSSDADRTVTNGWKCPRSGIYNVAAASTWQSVAGSFHLATLLVNGGEQYNIEDRRLAVTFGATMKVKFTTAFVAGDIVVNGYQSTVTANLYTSVWISLVKPL